MGSEGRGSISGTSGHLDPGLPQNSQKNNFQTEFKMSVMIDFAWH